ncbi:MAG: hypothetical protein JNL79_09585 [Myxococcales bacterium]|nr:hypothetical protein [Myxococcales bacterium]
MALVPCTHCRRHVQVASAACPFCGGALALVAPVMRPVAARLRRGAVAALGASAILVGCSSGDGGQVVALYGVPPSDSAVDGTADSTTDTGADTGAADSGPSDMGSDFALYGAPTDTGTLDAGDAAADTKETGVAPPYGLPPSDAG